MTQRVDLHRNFRSREEVLSYANDICERIMARDLGNVAYDEAAALYPGAVYPKPAGVAQMFAPELLLADSDDALLEEQGARSAGAQSAGAADGEDKKILEARMVARRMKRLMEEQLVTDKEETGRASACALLGYCHFAAQSKRMGGRLCRSAERGGERLPTPFLQPDIFGGRGTEPCLVCCGFWIIPDRIFRLLRSFALRSSA